MNDDLVVKLDELSKRLERIEKTLEKIDIYFSVTSPVVYKSIGEKKLTMPKKTFQKRII